MKAKIWIGIVWALMSLSCGPMHTHTSTTIAASESKRQGTKEEAKLHRKLKPLLRPQIRFEIERAIKNNDSCWVVVCITIPYASIRKHELFSAKSVLHTPEGFMELNEMTLDARTQTECEDSCQSPQTEIDTRSGSISYLYYSSKFIYDERMERHADISIITSLTDGRYTFYYSPIVLPVYWNRDCRANPLWPLSESFPADTLLRTSPFESIP